MIPTCHMHPGLPAFSRLVYGAWRLADDATATPQTVLRNIEICLDQGITTFDHADIYGGYRCEALKAQLQLVLGSGAVAVRHADAAGDQPSGDQPARAQQLSGRHFSPMPTAQTHAHGLVPPGCRSRSALSHPAR